MLRTLHNFWRTKKGWISATLTLTSMSMAHYIGFVLELPKELIAAAGHSLILDVTGPFILYLLLSIGFSRVLTGFLYFLAPLALVIGDRLQAGGKKLTWPEGRKFIRSHNGSMFAEPYALSLIQLIFAIALLFTLYIGFRLSLNTGIALFAYAFIVFLAILLRAGIFNRLRIFHSLRLLPKRRIYREKFLLAFFVAAASALVILSFSVGYERMRLLMSTPDRQIATRHYSGYAKFLAGSDGMLLIVENSTNGRRFILFKPNYAMGIEDKKAAFPPLSKTND